MPMSALLISVAPRTGMAERIDVVHGVAPKGADAEPTQQHAGQGERQPKTEDESEILRYVDSIGDCRTRSGQRSEQQDCHHSPDDVWT